MVVWLSSLTPENPTASNCDRFDETQTLGSVHDSWDTVGLSRDDAHKSANCHPYLGVSGRNRWLATSDVGPMPTGELSGSPEDGSHGPLDESQL